VTQKHGMKLSPVTKSVKNWNQFNSNKIFLCCQPCQLVKNYQWFGNHFCPHHQGNDDGETSVILTNWHSW